MTGQEHYEAAEKALAEAKSGDTPLGGDAERYFLATAQVHATLALAATVERATTPMFTVQAHPGNNG